MKKEQFRLKSVKMLNEGGVECEYIESRTSGKSTMENTHKVASPEVRHPDMNNELDKLKSLAMEKIGMNPVESMRSQGDMPASAKTALKSLSGLLDGIKEDTEDRTTVFGVHIKTRHNKPAIIINTKWKTAMGQRIAINTPMITVDPDEDEQIMEVIKQIEFEVWEYIINGKKAQLEIPVD